MASRSLGGVSITDISRRPSSDMCSVRGMGVALMRQHVDVVLDLLQPLFVLHAEALLFVDNQQAEIAETRHLSTAAGACRSAISTLPAASIGQHGLDFLGGAEPAEHLDAHRKRMRSAA